jgi:hypothetical protein
MSVDTLLIKRYNHLLIDKYISAYLDDILGGENGYENTILFMLCVVELLQSLAVFF